MAAEMTPLHLALRYAHITMGFAALLSGAASMTFRKGSRLHRLSGNVFFVSILVVGGVGAIMATFTTPNMGNLLGGLMAVYLVSTAWGTVVRTPGETGGFEIGAALGGLAIAGLGTAFAVLAATSPTGRFAGYPVLMYGIFASIALLGAALDVKVIARGGIAGPPRTTRHLWRMCLAFFMATGSFFFGQAKFFPVAVRESGLLSIPALLPLALLIYWLVRVRLVPWLKRRMGATMVSRTSATNG